MRALLLAAGFGTRLGELTKSTPKPLLRVGKTPLLAFYLHQLWIAGVTEVVINTHHLSEKIHSFIRGYETKINVILSHEEKILGTAGTLKKHIDYLSEDDFFVMHADNFFLHPLSKFLADHKSRKVGVFGSLGFFETPHPESCGVLVINSDKTILEYHEKVADPPTNLANAAVYLFTPQVREAVVKLGPDESDIGQNLIPKIKTGLFTHKFEGLFVDIGTPEGLKIANDHNSSFGSLNIAKE